MSPADVALARRAVACPRWRWLPGMLVLVDDWGGMLARLTGQSDADPGRWWATYAAVAHTSPPPCRSRSSMVSELMRRRDDVRRLLGARYEEYAAPARAVLMARHLRDGVPVLQVACALADEAERAGRPAIVAGVFVAAAIDILDPRPE